MWLSLSVVWVKNLNFVGLYSIETDSRLSFSNASIQPVEFLNFFQDESFRYISNVICALTL
jgi:hypothetical protein